MTLPKGMCSDKTQPLPPAQSESFRSATYQVNLIGREGRPEVAGAASQMASKVNGPAVADAIIINSAVRHLKNTAKLQIKL